MDSAASRPPLPAAPLDGDGGEAETPPEREEELREGRRDDDDDGGGDRDDDDDDEEEEDEPVTLGFVEKPQNPRRLLRHMFPSKAGGAPAWLDPVDLPPQRSRTCGFCDEPLQFVLQVYAPLLDEEFAFHRTLFVFMCASMNCLLRDQHEQWRRTAGNPSRSVKVFRCQMPQKNPFYSCEPPRQDGSGKPLKEGAPLCCWCGTWKGEKVCSSCKKALYCSERHQIVHWRTRHKSECRQLIAASELSDSSPKLKYPSINRAASSNLWPEFEIINEDESEFDEEALHDNDTTTALVPKHDSTDEVFQSLSDNFESDNDKKSWASFQERVARAPHQVLRYCRDMKAKPLWPVSSGRPSKDDIPKCRHCSGPLCYEFQIMPQLLYYFGVKNEVDSLDWATIVVYACAASCDAGMSYKDEFAWVQLYTSNPIP